MSDETIDYAIIGAGVSGLYTAWRILNSKEGHGKTVRVFEASERTGGRLLTWLPAGEDGGLRAELGGMRYFEKQQVVTALIKELGLEKQSIKFWVDGPGLIWSFRGYRTAENDTATASSRYRLRPGEDISSFDLVNTLIDAVLEQNGITEPPETWEKWNEIKKKLHYQGKPLWKVGFWNLLYDFLSPEAYRYIVDTFGYYTPTLNWNAAEAFQNISLDFTQKPQYRTLSKGYDQIPRKLEAKILELGGHDVIRMKTPLIRFEMNGDHTVRLELPHNETLKARNIVLALPRRSMELLWPTETFNLLEDEHLRDLVRSVRPYPAFKLFLFYPNGRWWEDLGFNGTKIEHGRSVTDMPIRQTYYLRPDELEGAKAFNLPIVNPAGLIMASYDDSIAVDFWQGLELPPEEQAELDAELPKAMDEIFQAFTVGRVVEAAKLTTIKELHIASPVMIRHARQQLALLHGVPEREIPPPQQAMFADWSLDPYGGGWHFWEPQVNAPDHMPKVRKPLAGKPVYIVGEAYSGLQGWVEGALTTAEHVLQDHLGFPKPEWLKDVHYFGP